MEDIKQKAEEQVFKRAFPYDEFNINDYNDWAKENSEEAYRILLAIANDLQNKLLIKST